MRGMVAPPSFFRHVVAVVTLRGTFPPRAGATRPSFRPVTLTLTISHRETFAKRVERDGHHSFRVACPFARPLWIPAFAGMTGVLQRTRARRCFVRFGWLSACDCSGRSLSSGVPMLKGLSPMGGVRFVLQFVAIHGAHGSVRNSIGS